MENHSIMLFPGIYRGVLYYHKLIPPAFWRDKMGDDWKRSNKIQKGWGKDSEIIAYYYELV